MFLCVSPRTVIPLQKHITLLIGCPFYAGASGAGGDARPQADGPGVAPECEPAAADAARHHHGALHPARRLHTHTHAIQGTHTCTTRTRYGHTTCYWRARARACLKSLLHTHSPLHSCVGYLCPPDQEGEGRGPRQRPPSAAPEYVATSFSPSLPGALEGLTWSQWGRHLAVCMEGVVRVYDWPTTRVQTHNTHMHTTHTEAYNTRTHTEAYDAALSMAIARRGSSLVPRDGGSAWGHRMSGLVYRRLACHLIVVCLLQVCLSAIEPSSLPYSDTR